MYHRATCRSTLYFFNKSQYLCALNFVCTVLVFRGLLRSSSAGPSAQAILLFLFISKQIVTGVAWLSSVRGAMPFCTICVSYGQAPFQIILIIYFSGGLVFLTSTLIRVHVKSSWPLYIGIHLCYNRIGKTLLFTLKKRQNLNYSFFGFSSATRGNEAGIMSNRGLACHGETQYFLQSTHRPSRWESCMNKKKFSAFYY